MADSPNHDAPLSLETKGRVLVHAAKIYDYVQPLVTLGQEQRLNDWVAQQMPLKPGDHALDIGCGTGLLTWAIAQKHPACTVEGIDASLPMIQVGIRKRSSDRCTYRQAVAESLPYDNESFDAVTSALFFHHVNREDKERSLREAWRVLRPGGLLLIADMGPPYTWLGWAMSQTAYLLFEQPEIKENMNGILPELITAAGFESLEEIGRFSGYILVHTARKGTAAP